MVSSRSYWAEANTFTVFEDAKHIKPLTKADMIAFFNEYVDPSSPARAKLAVHMHALGKSKSANPAIVEEVKPIAEKLGEKVETVASIVANGVAKVEEELSKVGLVKLGEGWKTENGGNGVEAVEIKDVRHFKASLAVTPGPLPVKDISEFEDLEAKL